MSNRNKNNLSDYNRPRTDLNRLIPDYNKKEAKILEGLNHNLFNRFLTKDEVKRVFGIVGSNESNRQPPPLPQPIAEPTPYRQANQLQPMIYSKVGNVDWFMSFVDFMNRLERLGVNIDRFNEWGNSLQFNWIPPIDIDKLINFQDYFWDTSDNSVPEYITIKNQCTWVQGRNKQILNSIASSFPVYPVVDIIEITNAVKISGNLTSDFRVGEYVVVRGTTIETQLVRVEGVSYDAIENTTAIELDDDVGDADNDLSFGIDITFPITVTEIAKTELPVASAILSENQIIVEGNVTEIFVEDYVFSSEYETPPNGPLSPEISMWTVESSNYDIENNTTVITVKQDMDSFDWDRITARPLIRSVESEERVICENPYSREEFGTFSEIELGEVIWTRNILITEGTTGDTDFGSPIFEDASGDFSDVQVGDTLRILNTGYAGDYDITNVLSSTQIAIDQIFFDFSNIEYEIVRDRTLSDIELENPPLAVTNAFWWDTTTDQLRQFNAGSWNVQVENFSAIVDVNKDAHLIDLGQTDDWSQSNKWTHRNEILNFTGKVRAQFPIIEFFPYLELSEHSFARKSWRYRRNLTVSYTDTDAEPTLFELSDIRNSADDSGDILFQTNSIILLDAKYGNLSPDLTEGTEIELSGFGAIDGRYLVQSSEFIEFIPNQRYRTRIFLQEPVDSIPFPIPADASIAPTTTSVGDPWLPPTDYQWQLRGIEDVSATSVVPERNPMLDVVVGNGTDTDAEDYSLTSTLYPETSSIGISNYEFILGLYFQEYKFTTIGTYASNNGAILKLDESLHDLVLYEDFQEGDIRVYINGQRQYGNFMEIPSAINGDYVGAIKFDSEVDITTDDIIRVELGEYAVQDVGKRAVSINTVSDVELYNLVDFRRTEQIKTEIGQYPWFSIYNVNKQPLNLASEIFKYADDANGIFIPDLNQRVFFDPESRDYNFEQFLIDEDTEALYLYFDRRELNDEYQPIWKKGTNLEQYVPVENNGFWDIPNQWYFNVKHENRKQIKLTELFRHFSTIVNAQTTPGIVRDDFTNVYHLDNVPNYGIGGTIKEHNDGFDTLISSIFVNNVNPISLIDFAHDRYLNHQATLKEIFTENLTEYFNSIEDDLTPIIAEEVKDTFEKNDRLDQWFGDSTTFDEATNEGVKNHIATIPFFDIIAKTRPYIVRDENRNLLQLVCHDGHRRNVGFTPATKEQFFSRILATFVSTTQTITSESDPFPTTIDGNPVSINNYVLRTNTTDRTRKLYRLTSVGWEFVDFDLIFAEVLLNIEQSLFEILSDDLLPENFVPKFSFAPVEDDPEYEQKQQEQFSAYLKERNLPNPFVNTEFRQNDPFTWNYAFTVVPTDPITGGNRADVAGSWQALYEKIYGTPYPHLEPWKLQGYTLKPEWWDDQYADASGTRRWETVMWDNVLNGVVPVGRDAPNGNPGTGLVGQISPTFSYIPVNVEPTNTNDGYEPDDVLPPYWNSANSSNPAVRTPYDANLQEFIITPNANFEFGQSGLLEWQWRVSSQKNYDDLIVAFKLQPLKFLNQTFGAELIDVACLQVDDRSDKVFSHEDVIFHGDIVQGNVVQKVNGLNQWYVHYNRYNGFDGISSEFRELWRDWDNPLTYQFSSFIDTRNFDISSDIFDVVNSDYQVLFKKTTGIRDIWLDALRATLISTPSRFSNERDTGSQWSISIDNTAPNGRPVETFAVQNYPVNTVIDRYTITGNNAVLPDTSGDVVFVSGDQTSKLAENDNIQLSGVNSSNIKVIKSVTYDSINNRTEVELQRKDADITRYTNLTKSFFRTYSFNIEAAEVQDNFGFDVANFSETAAPTLPTQLANNTTTYFADILFDGVNNVNVQVQGQNAQTFAELLNEINEQISDFGSAFIEDGNIVVASDTIGGTSSVVITDGGLFNDASNFFVGTSGNILTVVKFEKVFYVDDNVTSYFRVGEQLVVSDSTNFNGTYTITGLMYNPNSRNTRIEVAEEISLPNSVVDGVIEPAGVLEMPESWETGVGLSWSSNDTVPAPFDNSSLFYMIRLNDREFQLAETREQALADRPTPIVPTNTGVKQSFVGRIKNTFTAFSARDVRIYWKQHFPDTREVLTYATPIMVSGVQNMIDFINGYSAYLESIGFDFTDEDGTNRDPATNRVYDWQFETERLIEFLYNTRASRQQVVDSYVITPDASSNSFVSQNVITWVTGTRVTLTTDGTLPAEFDNPIASAIPYYIIQSATNGRFQLAASEADARAGIAIPFSDNGSGQIVLRLSQRQELRPNITLDPHRNQVFVDHDTGILSNVLAGGNLDLITNQRIYDLDGENLTVDDILVSRRDIRTSIQLSEQRRELNLENPSNQRTMAGLHLFFDGYEHVLQFSNYSSNNVLIYDSFLGINTPRFLLEFDRQVNFTLRPNVGGSVVLGNSQVQNIESAIDELRNAYSAYTSKEGDITTERVRGALGYRGPDDYADDLAITDKTQFTFYRGLIQRKGTNFAAEAFTNQLAFENVEIDEFWAYRLGSFGDSKQKVYPELKLLPTDLERAELRLEFVPLSENASNPSFIPVSLTNDNRWFDAPDQVEKLDPRDRFYINLAVGQRIEDALNYTQDIVDVDPTPTPTPTPSVTPSQSEAAAPTPTPSVTPTEASTPTPTPTITPTLTPTITPTPSPLVPAFSGASEIEVRGENGDPVAFNARVGFTVRDDGTIDPYNSNASLSTTVVPNEWWPAAPDADIGDEHEIEIVLTSGSLTTGSPFTGATGPNNFVSLSPSFRTIAVTATSSGDVGQAQGYIRIRNASNPSLITAGLNFELRVDIADFGGDAECFTAGSQIMMGNGSLVNIEDVKVGDMVVGNNNTVNKVLEVKRFDEKRRDLVSINGSHAFFTTSHPFLTEDGWKAVNETKARDLHPELNITKLEEGDKLIKYNNEKVLVESLVVVSTKASVYNLNVGGDDTYVVNEFIVHNK